MMPELNTQCYTTACLDLYVLQRNSCSYWIFWVHNVSKRLLRGDVDSDYNCRHVYWIAKHQPRCTESSPLQRKMITQPLILARQWKVWNHCYCVFIMDERQRGALVTWASDPDRLCRNHRVHMEDIGASLEKSVLLHWHQCIVVYAAGVEGTARIVCAT